MAVCLEAHLVVSCSASLGALLFIDRGVLPSALEEEICV